MTTTGEPRSATPAANGPGVPDGAAPAAAAPGVGRGDSGLRAELLLALELTALAAFAFSRPVLDSFGRSPETFIARGADASTIVLFGVVVALVPALVAVAVGLASRPLGVTTRRRVHMALVAILGGLALWRLGQDVTGWPPEATKLILAGFLGGPVLAGLWLKLTVTRTFLRYTGAASVLFLGQFLFTSPASSLVLGNGPEVDDEVADQVAGQLGDNPPNVVVVVFDALPLETLLDGTGSIDAEQFPNFGRLSGSSTWYRNNTTVAAFTDQAVPAILTGRYPEPGSDSSTDAEPENLFTLLGGSYDLHVQEQLTRLCPEDQCPDTAATSSTGLGPLLGDAATLWRDGATDDDGDGEFNQPGALGEERYNQADRWIDAQDLAPDSRPGLFFYHLVMPHGPWDFTDGGQLYEPVNRLPTGMYGFGWTKVGMAVGKQRHQLQLQASDRLLGQLLDRLEAAGTFDDSLIVVTADHGESFLADEPARGLSETNLDQIMWTPLLVKAPGQTRGTVDDSNVESIDIVPTVAEILGVDMPWRIDGVPAGQAEAGRGGAKRVADNKGNNLHTDDPDGLIEVDADTAADAFAEVLAADGVKGTGPDGVWKRTPHGDLFGRAVEGLEVGRDAGWDVEVERLGDIEDHDADDPPMIEVVGHVTLPIGSTMAYALNGTIGAVVEVEAGLLHDGRQLAHALLPPDLYVEGDNELTAYLVEGPVGHEVLRTIEIERRD